jgi:hypothetical protein
MVFWANARSFCSFSAFSFAWKKVILKFDAIAQ